MLGDFLPACVSPPMKQVFRNQQGVLVTVQVVARPQQSESIDLGVVGNCRVPEFWNWCFQKQHGTTGNGAA